MENSNAGEKKRISGVRKRKKTNAQFYLTNADTYRPFITENHSLALWSQISWARLTLISSVKRCSLALLSAITWGHFGKPVTIQPCCHGVKQVTQTESKPVMASGSQICFYGFCFCRHLFFLNGCKKHHIYSQFFTSMVLNPERFHSVLHIQFSAIIAGIT